MQNRRILITDHAHPALAKGLVSRGFDVEVRERITQEEVDRQLRAYGGVVINSKIRIGRSLMDTAPDLGFIARLGSGLEIIDLEAAAERRIAVFSAPEGNANAVAEHALGMLLCLSNHLLRADPQVRAFSWHRERNRGWEIAGRTVGIVGMGHTGRAFAEKLRGMGVRILGHDKYDRSWVDAMPWVEEASAEEVRSGSEILSLHLPLREETRHYVDARYLSGCRDGLVLINTSRGQCVSTADLVDALEDGKVRGACLDVLEIEDPQRQQVEAPDIYRRLLAKDHVVVTPHIAGWTYESLERIALVLLEKISTWLDNIR